MITFALKLLHLAVVVAKNPLVPLPADELTKMTIKVLKRDSKVNSGILFTLVMSNLFKKILHQSCLSFSTKYVQKMYSTAAACKLQKSPEKFIFTLHCQIFRLIFCKNQRGGKKVWHVIFKKPKDFFQRRKKQKRYLHNRAFLFFVCTFDKKSFINTSDSDSYREKKIILKDTRFSFLKKIEHQPGIALLKSIRIRKSQLQNV